MLDETMNAAAKPLSDIKLLIWTVMPTHHQSAFFVALRDIGVDVVVHYYDRVSPDRRQLGWDGSPELPPSERYVKASLNALRDCPDWAERIHILPGYSRPFLLGLACVLSMRGVCWLHWSESSGIGAPGPWKDFARRLYGRAVDRFALGALAIGDMASNDFQRWGIRATRIRYLPYSVGPLLSSNSQPPRKAPGVHFLFVGALCERKGIDVLLQAFRIVVDRYPESRLQLVGADQAEGHFQRLAETLQLTEKVSFNPPLAAREVAGVMSSCDVFVLASRFDGWGVVLNEAASLSKPLIATDRCGASAHLIRDGQSGFVVSAGDVGALAMRMTEYCCDPSLIASHGEVSRMLFEELRPERNATRLVQALWALQQPTAAMSVT